MAELSQEDGDRNLAVVKILDLSCDRLDLTSGVMRLSWGWGECDRSFGDGEARSLTH